MVFPTHCALSCGSLFLWEGGGIIDYLEDWKGSVVMFLLLLGFIFSPHFYF